MKVTPHSVSDYANALRSLLPPGAAWDWPRGGLGDTLLTALAQELVRIEAATQDVLDVAVATHKPYGGTWHIREYRRVAQEALAGVVEAVPRKVARIGCHIGDRLWQSATSTFAVPLVQVDHLVQRPACIGSRIGDRLWSTRSRYILRVRYYRSVVDPAALYAALAAFAQAHVYFWFEDITGSGGFYATH